MWWVETINQWRPTDSRASMKSRKGSERGVRICEEKTHEVNPSQHGHIISMGYRVLEHYFTWALEKPLVCLDHAGCTVGDVYRCTALNSLAPRLIFPLYSSKLTNLWQPRHIPMHWRCPADDRCSQREWKCQRLRALVYVFDRFLFNHCCQAKQKGVHRDVGHRIVFLFGFSFHFLPSQQQNPIFHEEVASFVSTYQRLQSCFLNRSGFHSRHSVRKQILISC